MYLECIYISIIKTPTCPSINQLCSSALHAGVDLTSERPSCCCCCSPSAPQSCVCHTFIPLISSWSEPGAENSKVWLKPCMDHSLQILVGPFQLRLFWDFCDSFGLFFHLLDSPAVPLPCQMLLHPLSPTKASRKTPVLQLWSSWNALVMVGAAPWRS